MRFRGANRVQDRSPRRPIRTVWRIFDSGAFGIRVEDEALFGSILLTNRALSSGANEGRFGGGVQPGI
jgi:hypothetical protein